MSISEAKGNFFLSLLGRQIFIQSLSINQIYFSLGKNRRDGGVNAWVYSWDYPLASPGGGIMSQQLTGIEA